MRTKLLIMCLVLFLGGCSAEVEQWAERQYRINAWEEYRCPGIHAHRQKKEEDVLWRAEYLKTHQHLKVFQGGYVYRYIEKEQVALGWLKEWVRAAYGKPHDTSHHESIHGTIDTWEYGHWNCRWGRYETTRILTFHDGILYSCTDL